VTAAFVLFGNPTDVVHFKNVIDPLKTRERERESEREKRLGGGGNHIILMWVVRGVDFL